MAEIPDRTESIFAAAVALPQISGRAAFLDQACEGDLGLRGHVEALLRAHDRAGHLLDRPVPGGLEQTQVFSPGEQPGDVIAGRYKLLEEIGEGGMGTVWVAEQTEPVRRKVALKLIKAGMDSKSVLARFEAERQALAVMDHPNIAKVLDGGLTDAGRPYFVMEYVKGVPITEYCDATRLSVQERLNLFVQVCQAVQHAHQKGIIHRDLKPSNILVAPYDDLPVPKVIDFGLAKAMHQSLTERTLHTAHETVLGTPLYMSPEQAQLNNIDVDTRSDIYSLGVLLYELLTGTTPLEKQRFKEAAWDEVKRIIREEEPPRPSMRISSTATLPSLAAGRQIEPGRLTKLVRGELDWIVMKSLEKDRSRRYETANGLAADVQRYLDGEPVLAAPPSARYRLRKFAEKHRAALTTAAAIGLLLVAGVAVSTWQAVRATRAEAAARLAEQDAQAAERLASERLVQVDAEKQRVEEEKQVAQAVRDFLQNKLLGQADSRTQADALLRAGGLAAEAKETPTIRELLDRAAMELASDKIDTNFPRQPIVQAEILQTVGNTYRGVGEDERAIGFLQRSAALRRQHLGPDHPATLTSCTNLASAYSAVGKLDLAVPLFEETLQLQRAKLGPDHPNTLRACHTLAFAYQYAGKLDLALPLHEETLKLRKAKLGPDHPDTLNSMGNLADAYRAAGKLDLALPLCEETLKLRKAKLGPDHPNTLLSMGSLARAYREAGKLGLALPLFEECYPAAKKHPTLRWVGKYLLDAYVQAGKTAQAATLAKELLADARLQLPKDSPEFAQHLAIMALSLLQAKAFADAEPLLHECLAIRENTLPDDWRTFDTKSLLGRALLGQKNYADPGAPGLLVAGYEGMKQREAQIPAESKVRLPEALDRLIDLYTATNKPDEVKKWQAELSKYPAPAAETSAKE